MATYERLKDRFEKEAKVLQETKASIRSYEARRREASALNLSSYERFSPAGRSFLRQAIHPPLAMEATKIPDGATPSSVATILRYEKSIPLAIEQGGLDATCDFCVWCPPGDNTMAVVAIGNPGVDFRTADLAAGTGPIGVGEVRVYWLSYFENQVLAGVLKTSHITDETIPAMIADHPPHTRYFTTATTSDYMQSWRTTSSSVTMHVSVPGVASQGMIHVFNGLRRFRVGSSCQPKGDAWPSLAPPEVKNPLGTPSAMPYDSANVYLAITALVTEIPFNESDFAAVCPNPYVAEAKHGAYIVHALGGPEQPYISAPPARFPIFVEADENPWKTRTDNNVDASLTAMSGDLYQWFPWSHAAAGAARVEVCPPPISVRPVALAGVDTAGLSQSLGGLIAPPWLAKAAVPYSWSFVSPAERGFCDTGMDNVAQSVTIGRSVSQAGVLSIKRIVSFEKIPLPASSFRMMVTRPAPLDIPALKFYHEIAPYLPTARRANDNDFGSVLSDILSAVGSVVPAASTLLSSLVPEAAPIAGVVAPLLATGAQLGASALRRRRPRPS